jgi:hypothetical protein
MKDLEKIKELHNYETIILICKINCEYTDKEYRKLITSLDEKYGICNLETDIELGVDLRSRGSDAIEFILQRAYVKGYKTWNEYLIETLTSATKEMHKFIKSHYIEKYTEEQIKIIFGEVDLT